MKYQFANSYGQEQAVAHLQNALRTGRISQAYILCGERGSGRRQLAMSFAKALQCRHRREVNGLIEACGVCHSCRQTESGNQPDILTVVPEKETKSGGLLVDDARHVKDDVLIRPYSSEWKIYIIPEADRMNTQAQNALLKTLEEPPGYIVMLLLAESLEGFLPTVLSRCVTLRLVPVPEELIAEHLVKAGTEQERAQLCARLSHGNPGRAAAYAADDAIWQFRMEAVSFLTRLWQRDAREILAFTGKLSDTEADLALDLCEDWARDLAVLCSTKRRDALILPDAEEELTRVAAGARPTDVELALSACSLARRRLAANGSRGQILEMLLLSLRGIQTRAGRAAWE